MTPGWLSTEQMSVVALEVVSAPIGKRSPRYSASPSLCRWIMVPIAAVEDEMRSVSSRRGVAFDVRSLET